VGSDSARPAGTETIRQVIHLLMLSFALLLRVLAWWQAALFALAAVAPAAVLNASVRRKDEPRVSGVILYPASVLVVILIFHKDQLLHIAAGSWAVLAVGDAASNAFGRRFGSVKLPWNTRKSVVGSAAMFMLSLPAAFFFLWWVAHPDFQTGYYLALATAGAFIGTVFESLPIPINDNPAVILSSSLAMYVTRLALT